MSAIDTTFSALTMKLYATLRGDDDARGHVLLVSSARVQEGKTTIATILARSIASLDDEPVALVDANVHAPCLHDRFGLANQCGFADCLTTGALSVLPSPITPGNLEVLPLGPTPQPGFLFKTQRIGALFDALRARYRMSIIDGNLLHEAGALPHLSDGVIMVIDSSSTRREVIQGVLSQAKVAPEKMLGAVLNKRRQYIPSFLYRGL